MDAALFGALLAGGIRSGLSRCLTPPGSSLKVPSKRTYSCSNAFDGHILTLHHDKVKGFLKKILFLCFLPG